MNNKQSRWKLINKLFYDIQSKRRMEGSYFWKVDQVSNEFLVLSRILHFIRSEVSKKGNENILDVGCGDGKISIFLKETSANIVGVDISPGMLRIAKHHGTSSTTFIAADGAKLPLISDAFNVVIFMSTLHHIPDWENAIKEAFRVLRTGGKIILIEPNSKPILRKILRKLKPIMSAEETLDLLCVKETLLRTGFISFGFKYLWFLGFLYPHFVARVPLKRIWRIFIPFIKRGDEIFENQENLGWAFIIVGIKPDFKH